MPLEDVQTQKSFKYLQEVETVAQDILTLKEDKLQAANAQNKLREALSSLKQTEERNSWLQKGSIYVQLPTEEIAAILKDEIAKSDDDLRDLRNKIRSKSQQLRDLEHQPRIEGLTLKPISNREAEALNKAFGFN
ncbi:unnamed protein product [Phyllotreta striolata]|uniref:P53 and DNA damage-regulated protein 1 n=1 Tax=Phyllotreta striolata TaxID=444603 RepID=A0A9N9TNN5_PHYSR|nr:unnamed protein product [Phyllotreta striolata]